MYECVCACKHAVGCACALVRIFIVGVCVRIRECIRMCARAYVRVCMYMPSPTLTLVPMSRCALFVHPPPHKKTGLDWEALENQRLVAPILPPAVDSDADDCLFQIVAEETVKGKGVFFGVGMVRDRLCLGFRVSPFRLSARKLTTAKASLFGRACVFCLTLFAPHINDFFLCDPHHTDFFFSSLIWEGHFRRVRTNTAT